MPFTFFLDMLGFGNKVGHISSQEKAEKFVDFMEDNKKIFDEWIRLDVDKRDIEITIINCYEFKYAFISDSIVMTFQPKKLQKKVSTEKYYRHTATLFYLMINRIITLLANLLSSHKILLRGGVSTKYSYIKNEFVVGEGLMEAYKLESNFAITPRIILSKELTDNSQFMEGLKLTSNNMYGGKRLIKRADDGYFYIDYIGYSLSVETQSKVMEKVAIQNLGAVGYQYQQKQHIETNNTLLRLHKEAIEDMYRFLQLKEDSEHYSHILEKYTWIKNYHNNHIKENRKIFKINED
jgi:hypothetical protein